MKINFKTLAVGLLIAVAASVSVGAATPGYGVGTANDDVVLKASQTTGYNTYINQRYGYSVDIPAVATESEATPSGDGCYFEDPKTQAVISTYGTRNMMNMTADQLYRIALNVNGSPQLSIQEKAIPVMSSVGKRRTKCFMKSLSSIRTAHIHPFPSFIR